MAPTTFISKALYRLKKLSITNYKGIKYNISYKLLNAADYGVPQKRERVFIIADLGGERASEILDLKTDMRGDIREREKKSFSPYTHESSRRIRDFGIHTNKGY